MYTEWKLAHISPSHNDNGRNKTGKKGRAKRQQLQPGISYIPLVTILNLLFLSHCVFIKSYPALDCPHLILDNKPLLHPDPRTQIYTTKKDPFA